MEGIKQITIVLFSVASACGLIKLWSLVAVALSPSVITSQPPDSYYQGNEPLFITPYLLSGQPSTARALARVKPFLPGVESYSGYMTVDNETQANMFFWFFPSERQEKVTPLILWLQGGPGASSMFGLFVENGPFIVEQQMRIKRRSTAWISHYHILYVDNPVGSGFSFVKDANGYPTNQTTVADHLYEFLVQFYELFPKYRMLPLYMAGESYAGKYLPSLAYKLSIMKEKLTKSNPVADLNGILIGNGLSNPETDIAPIGELLYGMGFVSYQQLQFINMNIGLGKALIAQKNFKKATKFLSYKLLDFIYDSTQCRNDYNFLYCNEKTETDTFPDSFLTMNETRRKIHVGNSTFNLLSDEVWEAMEGDIMDTVKPLVEYLLANTSVRILYYSGNLDIRLVPAVGTSAFLRLLEWPGRKEWLNKERDIWRNSTSGEVLGYSTTVGQLTFIIVRNAGHMVTIDKPEVCLDMVKQFIDTQ